MGNTTQNAGVMILKASLKEYEHSQEILDAQNAQNAQTHDDTITVTQ
jgi:hypothetical protein